MAQPKNKPHKVSLVDSDLSPNFVDEGAASGTEVGITASATFKHAKGPVTYSLTDDAGGAFAIDPSTGVVTVANGDLLDYETAHSQTISVSVTDGKVSALRSFEVAIGDVAEITVQRVSLASDGTEGNSHSFSPAISADGRYVFYSSASNLVSGDTNGVEDTFVFDRQTGTTERVSIASDGTEGNSNSSSPAISADGRYVAYWSFASNLVPGDTNSVGDIFVFDRQTETTERVSIASDGTQANHLSISHSISADGRYVAYASAASNLVPGDTNGTFDIFVFDRQTGTTERVSISSDGAEANSDSVSSTISADGRYVSYRSTASNLVPGDTNDVQDIFVFDRQTGTTERVSTASDGTEGDGPSDNPAISADGRYVAYESSASNLVPGDTNGGEDIFVFDRQTGTTERVSIASDGTEANGFSRASAISPDGRHVTYSSAASNLVAGDTNGFRDIFMFDRQTETTVRVSVASNGTDPNGESFSPAAMSADGGVVVYTSAASNLVPGDTNGSYDIFVVDTHDLLLI